MKTVSLIPVLLIFLASCYTPRYMYSPSAHNVPVLVQKGDSKLSAMLSSNLSEKSVSNNRTNESKSRGFDLQGAYAISNNFAIQAGYFKRTESNNGDSEAGRLDSSVINYKRNLTEFGLGYFKSLHRRDKVFFQVFGGIGMGKFNLTDDGRDLNNIIYRKTHQTDVTKFYLQPAMMFRPTSHFTISVSTRLSFIKFGNIKTDYSQDELYNYHLDSLSYGARSFWEPAFTNTIGFKKLPGIQFEYQFGFSTLLSKRYIDHRSFNFSAAIMLDIPKLFTRKAPGDKN